MTKENCIRKIIHKDGSESWHLEVRLRGLVVRETYLTKTEAKARRDEIRSNIRKGVYLNTSVSQKQTLTNLIDKFLEQCLSRYSNHKKMTSLLAWWKNETGSMRLQNFSSARVIEAQNKLYGAMTYRKKPRTGSTVNRYTAALSRVCRYGVSIGWLSDNPMRKVEKFKEGPSRNRFLSIDEISRLLDACERSENKNLYPMVKLGLLSGMRLGEIKSLLWKNVSFSQKIIYLEKTKNGDRRLIPISHEIEQIFKECATYGKPDETLVFSGRIANRAAGIRTAFAKALKDARIEGVVYHDLRRTFCSQGGMAGLTQLELQEILGHKSSHMTKIYLKYSQSYLSNAMERAQTKILGGTNGKGE